MVRLKKILVISFIGLLWFNTSYAANFNWKKVSTAVDDTSSWYYDSKTIYEVGRYKFFWQLTDYLNDPAEEKSVITHSMVNCDTYESKWIVYSGYSGQMGKGKLLDDFIVPEFSIESFEWTYHDPKKTLQGSVLKKVCNAK